MGIAYSRLRFDTDIPSAIKIADQIKLNSGLEVKILVDNSNAPIYRQLEKDLTYKFKYGQRTIINLCYFTVKEKRFIEFDTPVRMPFEHPFVEDEEYKEMINLMHTALVKLGGNEPKANEHGYEEDEE